jgi:ppGpp synthetase/RelA/SpoT-type nucleotidyltranferase
VTDPPSKTQLDKLGDRLRSGSRDEVDLRALDDYRRSFRVAYETVMGTARETLKLEVTGRPAKTTAAIIDKLNRQPIRLSQIQDIAGVRILAADVVHQDEIVKQLTSTFGNVGIDDRRSKPSHGYRAVHVIVELQGRAVEVQVRTPHQHQWAELSEKLADLIDPAIKYGGGPPFARQTLDDYSEILGTWEQIERQHAQKLEAAVLLKDAAGLENISQDGRKVLSLRATELENEVAGQRSEIGDRIRRLFDTALKTFANMKPRD